MNMFSYTGVSQSYAFPCFHSDVIPTSLVSTRIMGQPCELVMFQNSPHSGGNVTIGSDRLGKVGTGYVLQPGEVTGWIPANNLDNFWHVEENDSVFLTYMIIYACDGPSVDIPDTFPLPEILGFASHVTGGAGGEILRVQNTNDSGEGSLRNAIALAQGFDSSFIWITATGTVEQSTFLFLEADNVTIYVDPRYSSGFQLKEYGLGIRGCSNVIVYNMRSRPGYTGTPSADGFDLGFPGGFTTSDIALLNSSVGLYSDEGVYIEASDVTVQDCLIGTPVAIDAFKGRGILTNNSTRVTIRNTLLSGWRRAPRFRDGGTVQILNNINHGYPDYMTDLVPDGVPIVADIVGNYYRHNPQTPAALLGIIVDGTKVGDPQIIFDQSSFYFTDNFVDRISEDDYFISEDTINWAGVIPGSGVVDSPSTDISGILSSVEIFDDLLNSVGASPRDTLDTFITDNIQARTMVFESDPADYGGWPDMGA